MEHAARQSRDRGRGRTGRRRDDARAGREGIPVTLLEPLPDAAEDQRAATVHPPTVEMLVELGLEKEAFSEEPSGGMSAPLFHFRDRATGELFAVFDISLLKGEVPYPFVLQWEQYKLVHAALPHIRRAASARCASRPR